MANITEPLTDFQPYISSMLFLLHQEGLKAGTRTAVSIADIGNHSHLERRILTELQSLFEHSSRSPLSVNLQDETVSAIPVQIDHADVPNPFLRTSTS